MSSQGYHLGPMGSVVEVLAEEGDPGGEGTTVFCYRLGCVSPFGLCPANDQMSVPDPVCTVGCPYQTCVDGASPDVIRPPKRRSSGPKNMVGRALARLGSNMGSCARPEAVAVLDPLRIRSEEEIHARRANKKSKGKMYPEGKDKGRMEK